MKSTSTSIDNEDPEKPTDGGKLKKIYEEINVATNSKPFSASTSNEMTDFIEHCGLREDLASLKPTVNVRLPQFQQRTQTSQTQLQTQADEVDNRDNRDYRDYRMEDVRLRSYENWPVPYMDPGKLAAAGFFYTGDGDKVRCFECKVEICQWLEGDNPMADHQKWQEQCRFVRKIPCGNVPMGENTNNIPQPRARSRDVCGLYGIDNWADTPSDCHASLTNAEFPLPSSAKLGSLGIGRPKGPSHPEYASYDARLRTFESWPKSMPQTKECLADAGFYYTGKGDQTLCYHCGGGLKDWEINDDPWEQHAKWFSKCYYLLMVKGQEYVNTVTGQSMAPPTLEETMEMILPSCIKKVDRSSTLTRVEQENKEKIAEKSCDVGPSSPSGSSAGITENEKSPIVQEAPKITSTEITATQQSAGTSKHVDDARMCKICYNEELGVVFLPCGHIVACVKCAPVMTTCALCRQPVSMTVRAFFS